MEHFSRICKLLAIDIDGTLLTPDGTITPRTRAAIQAAQQRGLIVTLATARRFHGALPVASALGIDLPLILYDGALIVSPATQSILFSQRLSGHVAQEAVEIFHRYQVQPAVQPFGFLREEVWTGPAEFDNPEFASYLSFAQGPVERRPYALLCQGEPDPLRVVAFASEEAIEAVAPAISGLTCSWNRIKQGNFGCAELAVMHPSCSKASGVATLAAFYHIPLAEVMAIGDNNNDLEMLQTVGWGVAMGQAPAEVRAAAKAVTATNREDGVALAIEEFVLAQSLPAQSAHKLFLVHDTPPPVLPTLL